MGYVKFDKHSKYKDYNYVYCRLGKTRKQTWIIKEDEKKYLLISKSLGHMGEEIRLKDAAGLIPRACNRPKQNILLMILLKL